MHGHDPRMKVAAFMRMSASAVRPLSAVILSSLTLVVLLAPAGARAGALSVDECVGIALQRNAHIVSSDEAVRAATFRGREARGARLPNASLRGIASYAPLDGYDRALTEGGELGARLEVAQRLYDGGATRLLGRQAEVEVQQATSGKARTAADLRLDVRLGYVDLLAAERRAALLEQSVADLEAYAGTVRSLASGGAVPKTDVAKVEIQLETERIALEDERTAARIASAHLLDLLGLPLDDTIAIQDTVQLPAWSTSLAEPQNPELQEAGVGIHAAELDVRAARAERRPIVALTGSLGAWTSRGQLVDADSPHVLGYQAGVELDMPVWNWGASAARVDRQSATLNALRADYRVLQRRLESDYRTTVAVHETALHKLTRLGENRQRAAEQYQSVKSRYAGGGASSLEVLDAHRSLLEVAVQQQEVRSDADRAHAQLLRLAGEAP